MKRDLWDAVHKCTKCNGVMEKKELLVEGISIRGWECSKCNETVLHPEDAQKMFVFNKLRKGLQIKVGSLGQNLIMRFPKEAAEFYDITKGKNITLKAENFKKIELDISS